MHLFCCFAGDNANGSMLRRTTKIPLASVCAGSSLGSPSGSTEPAMSKADLGQRRESDVSTSNIVENLICIDRLVHSTLHKHIYKASYMPSDSETCSTIEVALRISLTNKKEASGQHIRLESGEIFLPPLHNNVVRQYAVAELSLAALFNQLQTLLSAAAGGSTQAHPKSREGQQQQHHDAPRGHEHAFECQQHAWRALGVAVNELATLGACGPPAEDLLVQLELSEWCTGGTLQNHLLRMQSYTRRSRRSHPLGYLPTALVALATNDYHQPGGSSGGDARTAVWGYPTSCSDAMMLPYISKHWQERQAAQIAAVAAALDVARGLWALHARGLVHGSLSPCAVMVALLPPPPPAPPAPLSLPALGEGEIQDTRGSTTTTATNTITSPSQPPPHAVIGDGCSSNSVQAETPRPTPFAILENENPNSNPAPSSALPAPASSFQGAPTQPQRIHRTAAGPYSRRGPGVVLAVRQLRGAPHAPTSTAAAFRSPPAESSLVANSSDRAAQQQHVVVGAGRGGSTSPWPTVSVDTSDPSVGTLPRSTTTHINNNSPVAISSSNTHAVHGFATPTAAPGALGAAAARGCSTPAAPVSVAATLRSGRELSASDGGGCTAANTHPTTTTGTGTVSSLSSMTATLGLHGQGALVGTDIHDSGNLGTFATHGGKLLPCRADVCGSGSGGLYNQELSSKDQQQQQLQQGCRSQQHDHESTQRMCFKLHIPHNIVGGGSRGNSANPFGNDIATFDLPSNTTKWRTLAYSAPELLSGLKQGEAGPGAAGSTASGGGKTATLISPAADVFSFGALLWQLCSGGRPPHYERHPAQILMGLLTGDLDLDLDWPDDSDGEVADLGRACLTREPERRPTSSEIVSVLERALARMETFAAVTNAGLPSGRSGGGGCEYR